MDRVRKYKIIKKLLIPILALAIFLLPISPSLNLNKDGHLAVGVERNKVLAASTDPGLKKSTLKWKNSGSTTAEFDVTIAPGGKKGDKEYEDGWTNVAFFYVPTIPQETVVAVADSIVLVIFDETGKEVSHYDFSIKLASLVFADGSLLGYTYYPPNTETWLGLIIGGLTVGKNYTAGLYYLSTDGTGDISLFGSSDKNYWNFGEPKNITFRTAAEGENIIGDSSEENGGTITGEAAGINTGCSLIGGWDGIKGCIASFFYMIWEISALIARTAAGFLDFFVYYSTNSTSYTNGFITKGWGAIRDVANIFFIIALLYIAIKTILSLNTTNNKKIIGIIIIVALLINFSLFFTQVIIDGSNILAKVFYNNIDSKYTNKTPAVGAEGEKSISVGLVDKFNPQGIITQDTYTKHKGAFIFITILFIAITLYTAYIFFAVALLFVSRVVMLWISMIFAPIAFASYTLPFDIPGLGHKEWWKQLLENAFLAPLFIFMLYIVVMFAGFLSEIGKYTDSSSTDTIADLMQHIMKVIIPLAILFLLLMKAKEMAVKYAGEMGKAVMSVGKFVGGVAVGAAAGSLAFAGRKSIGHIASNISQNEGFRKWAANNGKFGKLIAKTTSGAASASFDARGIKVMGKDLGSTGLKVGKNVRTGGFAKVREEKIKKQEEYVNKLLDTSDAGIAKLMRDNNWSMGRAKEEARRLNAGKRTAYADSLNIDNMTKRIAASKIRKDFATLQQQAQTAAIMTAMVNAQNAQNAANAGAGGGAAGGGAAGGGGNP